MKDLFVRRVYTSYGIQATAPGDVNLIVREK